VRIEKDPEWHAKLGEHNKTVMSDLVTQMHEIADRVVPVDTGHLKESLYSQVSVDGTEGVVGADAHYALYVEDGHRVAYRGADGETHYTGDVVPPQPFLRVAMNTARIE
jgi:hypothetical protein